MRRQDLVTGRVGVFVQIVPRLSGRGAAVERGAWIVVGPLLMVGGVFVFLSLWFLAVLVRGFAG